MFVLEAILWGVAVLLVLPCCVLLIECVAAVLPGFRRRTGAEASGDRGRVAVLIPAHDEQAGIAATVGAILPQLGGGDRLLVVADNCSDATAASAREAGAEVTERFNAEERGKGYALAAGVAVLADDPPEVVIVVDADMTLADGSVDALARQVEATGKAAQAVNVLEAPAHAGARELVACLAFAMKNVVRPRGLMRLGLPCHLMGTGMALPWEAVRGAKLATGHIVEDMQLGLELAMKGYGARLCEGARVSGCFPGQARAARTQHQRWEQGHLQVMATQAPRLIDAGFRRGRFSVVALALDLCVPPLSLLVMLLAAGLGVSVGAAWVGLSSPLLVLLAGLGMVALAVGFGCCGLGRGARAWAAVAATPVYLAWKVPLYVGLVLHPQRRWHRTERETG